MRRHGRTDHTERQSIAVPARYSAASVSAIWVSSSRPLCSVGTKRGASSSPSKAVCASVSSVGCGPISTQTSGLSCASVRKPSAKRTGSRTWRRQYEALRTSSLPTTLPLRFDTMRALGGWRRVRATAASNVSSIGSTSGEWKACDTGRRWQRTPRAVKAAQTRSTAAAAPAITVCAGPFCAAIDSVRASPASADDTAGSGANTAAIAPPGGKACISRPRSAVSASASSSENTPAMHAATYSPSE
jgi:hypothetical protein